jgi:hypothetical protein
LSVRTYVPVGLMMLMGVLGGTGVPMMQRNTRAS